MSTATPTEGKKPEPKGLEDFKESKAISHPSLPEAKQFMVTDHDGLIGIWSSTHNKLIVPMEPRDGYFFQPIVVYIPTNKVFWKYEPESIQRAKFYMSESSNECASVIKIPDEYYVQEILSEKIILLRRINRSDSNAFSLHSLETKSIGTLTLEPNCDLMNVHVNKDKDYLILFFMSKWQNKHILSTFMVHNKSFRLEQMKKLKFGLD
jgi:hypothetical protein